MDFEEMHVVYTCGMCEEICNHYQDHPCLNGYSDVYLDENYYFYPLLDDKETIIRRAILSNGKEGLIEDSIYGNKENTCQNSFQSPPTMKKPAKRRKSTTPSKSDREKRKLLWEEVAAALNANLSAVEVKLKFKSLRDTYRKIIQAEHRASGSAAVISQDRWKFYDCCEFLRDSGLIKDTSSNVSSENTSNRGNVDIESSIDDNCSEACDEDLQRSQASGVTNSGRKRGRSNKDDAIDSASALNRIADALCRENVPPTLPEPPKIDTVGAFLIGIGNQIRQLPQPIQMDIIKQFTDIVYNTTKYNS
ncbi:uncharacterized protein LOC141532409 [Cotesia typhae]|uniref:uncharacterized protein LOC141532409 n=1 Tax=Cotesia typhae TaxID=2053667 RepID=UPI003D68C680